MSFNPNYKYQQEVSECSSRGACSISPAISSLQELVLKFLQQSSYYILELEKLGATNVNIKYEIVKTLSALVSVNEFSENQLFAILIKEFYLLEDTIKTYRALCEEQNITPEELPVVDGFNSLIQLSCAISLGDRLTRENYKKYTDEQKVYIDILLIITQSVSLNLVKLKDFGECDEKVSHEILQTLNMFNTDSVSIPKLKEKIVLFSNLDHELQLKNSSLLLKIFGGISKVKVSHSTEKGKAILVSGNNFFDLLRLLEDTKDKNIDVYTHSNLLIVHALQTFRNYPHLKGHYGNLTQNNILDFATFQGSILLTKNFKSNKEYFYRGRLFSSDDIVPNGVIKIKNNDYSELIDSAQKAKGFSKGRIKEDTELGYDVDTLYANLENITNKVKSGEIKRLYIIGINSYLESQNAYFKELLKKVNEDEFVISFSAESKRENVLTINVGDYLPLVTQILNKVFENYPVNSGKVVFFFTTCDVMTISNLVLLNELGAKNLFMVHCSPTFINPTVFELFKSEYNIRTTTSVYSDLNFIRQNKSSQ